MKKVKQQSENEIQQRAEKIKSIYKMYLKKLNMLKKKQTEIINQFIKEMERKKIEEIRKLIK